MKPTTDFPFLLDNPRAWRTYLGGRMLDALHGDSNGEDGHFPEEWILSTVAARNAGREQFPEEGMSHLRGTDVTLRSVLESDTEGYLGKGAAQPTLGVLTKLIDSAERLTLQVHPDKPTALRLFQSQYGKTECWHILSGTCRIHLKTCHFSLQSACHRRISGLVQLVAFYFLNCIS